MTYSIVACDRATGDLGVAVQSRFLSVGSVVPWARAGVGAIATQSYANVGDGPDGLALLAGGANAEDALAALVEADQLRAQRQVGAVDARGGSACYTGSSCFAWAGGRIEFIRRFEFDYKARPAYLIENYRSTAHIIATANDLIAEAGDRMKTGHPIRIDRSRAKAAPGGGWQKRDAVGQGRVQILPTGLNDKTQAMSVMAEFERLAGLDPRWDWSTCYRRQWKWLDPVRSYCEWRGIPVQMANEDGIPFWRLRETRDLLGWLRSRNLPLVTAEEMKIWLGERSPDGGNPFLEQLREAVTEYSLETGDAELPVAHFRDWLAEWGREARRRQTGLLLLTAHRAKGLEFDHVVVLDGDWHANEGRKTGMPSPVFTM